MSDAAQAVPNEGDQIQQEVHCSSAAIAPVGASHRNIAGDVCHAIVNPGRGG
jgi:hypothetical protein